PTGLPRRNRTGLVIATPWRPRAQSLRSTLNTVPSDEDDGMARKLSRGSGQRNPTPAQLRPTRRGVAYLALPHGAPGCNGVCLQKNNREVHELSRPFTFTAASRVQPRQHGPVFVSQQRNRPAHGREDAHPFEAGTRRCEPASDADALHVTEVERQTDSARERVRR